MQFCSDFLQDHYRCIGSGAGDGLFIGTDLREKLWERKIARPSQTQLCAPLSITNQTQIQFAAVLLRRAQTRHNGCAVCTQSSVAVAVAAALTPDAITTNIVQQQRQHQQQH